MSGSGKGREGKGRGGECVNGNGGELIEKYKDLSMRFKMLPWDHNTNTTGELREQLL